MMTTFNHRTNFCSFISFKTLTICRSLKTLWFDHFFTNTTLCFSCGQMSQG
jgi:hypothetical protein